MDQLLLTNDIQPFNLLDNNNNCNNQTIKPNIKTNPNDYLSPIYFPNGPSCGYLLALLSKLNGKQFINPYNPTLTALKLDTSVTVTPNQTLLHESMEKVLDDLKACKDLRWFVYPVKDTEAPKYYEYITKPMCFTLMKQKLSSYKSRTEFINDLNLIYTNCVKYNGLESWIVKDPGELLRKKILLAALKIPDLNLNLTHADVKTRSSSNCVSPIVALPNEVSAQSPVCKTHVMFGDMPVIQWDATSPVPALPLSNHPLPPPQPPSFPAVQTSTFSAPSVSHKSALTTLRAWSTLRTRAEYIADIMHENMLKVSPSEAMKVSINTDMDWQVWPTLLCNNEYVHALLRKTICLILGYTGYTQCQASLVYVLSDLYIDLLTKFGFALQTVHLFPIRACRVVDPTTSAASGPPELHVSSEKQLQAVLHMCGFDLIGLHDHAVLEVYRSAYRMTELDRRVENKVNDLILGGGGKQLVDDLPQDPDLFTSGNFLADILGEDTLGLGDIYPTSTHPKPTSTSPEIKSIPTLSTLWTRDHVSGYYYKHVDATLTEANTDMDLEQRLANDPACKPWPKLKWTPDKRLVVASKPCIGLLQAWFVQHARLNNSAEINEDFEFVNAKDAKLKMSEREGGASTALAFVKALQQPKKDVGALKRKR